MLRPNPERPRVGGRAGGRAGMCRAASGVSRGLGGCWSRRARRTGCPRRYARRAGPARGPRSAGLGIYRRLNDLRTQSFVTRSFVARACRTRSHGVSGNGGHRPSAPGCAQERNLASKPGIQARRGSWDRALLGPASTHQPETNRTAERAMRRASVHTSWGSGIMRLHGLSGPHRLSPALRREGELE